MEFKEFYDFVVKVHSIAKIGLTYSTDPYALENYTELNELSKDMLEKFMDVKFDRPNMFSKDVYPTPNVSCRTLIVNDKNEVLLVKEARTNNWSFPGGWCDLYKTPSEAAFAEVSQEAGIEPKMERLIGVLDRTPFKSNQNVPEYVIVFVASIDGKKFHEHCHETNDVRFFPLDNLPEMSRKLSMREIERIIEAYKNNKVIFD
jgi:8-oxo-dGTP diphosphatase